MCLDVALDRKNWLFPQAKPRFPGGLIIRWLQVQVLSAHKRTTRANTVDEIAASAHYQEIVAPVKCLYEQTIYRCTPKHPRLTLHSWKRWASVRLARDGSMFLGLRT